jgi:general secretion pathway protein K
MSRRRQSGIALITALLIVVLAAAIAASLTRSQGLDIRRTGNVLNAGQAQLYIDGAEAWALRVLGEDARDSDTDHLGENWAQTVLPVQVPGGYVTGYLVDLQGAINLNSLLDGDKIDGLAQGRLERLFERLELPGSRVEAVIDWLDPDLVATGSEGAEDDYYLSQDRPYRAGNGPFAVAGELRLVRGIEPETFDLLTRGRADPEDLRLRPLITALPERTEINVNTAPLDVLVALGLDPAAAEQIVSDRSEEPFERIEEFLNHPAVSDTPLATQEGLADALGVRSAYFLLVAESEIDRARARRYALLQRGQDGMMRVVMRSRAGL